MYFGKQSCAKNSTGFYGISTFLMPIDITKVSTFSDLLNVFEVFLPQLLLYPNASDPLNGDAASLMMKDKKLYDQKVKGEHIFIYGNFSDNIIPPCSFF